MEITLFVVTTPELKQNGRVSFQFLVQPGVPRDFLCSVWGIVTMRCKGENEVNPFKLARGEPDAVGDDGVRRWDIHLFADERGNILSGGVDENPPKEEGLQQLLRDATEDTKKIALLMEKNLLDRFRGVCNSLGITLRVHDCPEPLSTS